MIKTVHFVQLTLLIFLLFFLFQVTSISISSDKNLLAEDNNKESAEETIPLTAKPEYLLITGDTSSSAANVEQGLIYLKASYKVEKSLLSLSNESMNHINTIILASDTMVNAYDLATLKELTKKGINIIFASLPVSELDELWANLLGIDTLATTSSQEGILVFEGFFLGISDRQEYDDLKVNAADIHVKSTCKTYIAGYSEKNGDNKFNKNDMQDVLWRNIYEGSQIFVVNGSFLQTSGGIGILTAILSQMNEDFVYPVINANALIFNNMPYLSQENANLLQKVYARSPERFFEDLILPDVIAICLSSNLVPTFYGVSSYDEKAAGKEEFNTSILDLLQKELRRIGGELGISAYDRSNPAPEQKVLGTITLYQELLGKDYLSSIHLGAYDKNRQSSLISSVKKQITLKTLLSDSDNEAAFSRYDEKVINLPVISEGFQYDDREYFQLQCMASALGIITHEVDMSKLIFPETKSSDWTVAYSDLTSMLHTFWVRYIKLDSLTVSDSGIRVNEFLSMNPQITEENNKISIHIDGFNQEAFFILRTEKHIRKINKGKYIKIDDGFYLISAKAEDFEIALQ